VALPVVISRDALYLLTCSLVPRVANEARLALDGQRYQTPAIENQYPINFKYKESYNFRGGMRPTHSPSTAHDLPDIV
jgi:hypothetical protein